jgi:Skp family chaperone for outer membrane proteins
MKRTLIHAVILLAAVAVGWPLLQATIGEAISQDEHPKPSQALPVAVVDVGKVFRTHEGFKRDLEQFAREVEEFRKLVAVRQVELESAQKKLQTLKPGTSDWENAQLLLSRLQTELRLFAERQQQQVASREASLYADMYGKVTAAVQRYADAHGIRLVLRAQGEAPDPRDPKSVLHAVNQSIVYQAGLDITEEILKELSGQSRAAS